MNFNYHKIYGDYSNEELFNILRSKDQYQQQAVVAAEDVLENRGVSKEQQQLHLKPVTKAPASIAENWETRFFSTGEATDLLNDQDLLVDSTGYKKWYRYLLIVLGIDIVRQAYGSATILFGYFDYVKSDLSFIFSQLLSYAFQILILLLAFKKVKAGWYILMCISLYSGIVRMYALFRWLVTDGSFNPGIFQLVITLAISIVVLVLLWKPSVQALFNINDRLRNNLFAFTCLISLLYVLYHFVSTE